MNNDNKASHREAYWQANLRLMFKLLVVWFVISFVFGIVLFDVLNSIQIGGYKLGFWFAQQGSMYGFVLIVFIYAKSMASLDKKFNFSED